VIRRARNALIGLSLLASVALVTAVLLGIDATASCAMIAVIACGLFGALHLDGLVARRVP